MKGYSKPPTKKPKHKMPNGEMMDGAEHPKLKPKKKGK